MVQVIPWNGWIIKIPKHDNFNASHKLLHYKIVQISGIITEFPCLVCANSIIFPTNVVINGYLTNHFFVRLLPTYKPYRCIFTNAYLCQKCHWHALSFSFCSSKTTWWIHSVSLPLNVPYGWHAETKYAAGRECISYSAQNDDDSTHLFILPVHVPISFATQYDVPF